MYQRRRFDKVLWRRQTITLCRCLLYKISNGHRFFGKSFGDFMPPSKVVAYFYKTSKSEMEDQFSFVTWPGFGGSLSAVKVKVHTSNGFSYLYRFRQILLAPTKKSARLMAARIMEFLFDISYGKMRYFWVSLRKTRITSGQRQYPNRNIYFLNCQVRGSCLHLDQTAVANYSLQLLNAISLFLFFKIILRSHDSASQKGGMFH